MISDVQVATKLLALRQSAADRGIEFDLPFQSIKNILSAKKCFYTGQAIYLEFEQNHPFKLTIDRIDASKGYIKGNVVACANYFNQKKKDLTVEEIRLLAKKVG